LVSHGYVVATIDHPYAASGVIFPDGRLAKVDPRMFDPDHPGHPAFIDSVIPFLAQDAIFHSGPAREPQPAGSRGES
jgi:hypothetical protein